jgi:hypothetical protein
MLDLYNYSLLTIFLVGLAAILAAIELGHWLGVRAGGETAGNVSTLEGAVIGLLALILGFTFAALRLGAMPYSPRPMLSVPQHCVRACCLTRTAQGVFPLQDQ